MRNDAEPDRTYAQLQTLGVEFVTPLQRLTTPAGDDLAMVCFKDPDGIYLEIISGLNVARRAVDARVDQP